MENNSIWKSYGKQQFNLKKMDLDPKNKINSPQILHLHTNTIEYTPTYTH